MILIEQIKQKFINNIKNNSYWAGHIKNNKMALLLDINILC